MGEPQTALSAEAALAQALATADGMGDTDWTTTPAQLKWASRDLAALHGLGYSVVSEATPGSSEAGLREALADGLERAGATPFRWMLDGSPCWCISADEPHEGWVHAPACDRMLREYQPVILSAALRTPVRSEPGLDVERLAEAMASCPGVNWPKRWTTNESHDFSWVARQVASRYAALSPTEEPRS